MFVLYIIKLLCLLMKKSFETVDDNTSTNSNTNNNN